MKNLLLILFVFLGFVARAQFPSQPTPTQFSTGWFKQGWHQADSGHILSNRLPNFTPRFPGTIILYQQAGVDSSVHYYNGGRWIKLTPGFDSVSLSNRINLKLNITDTTGRWWGAGKRWVDTVYRKNDSTIGFTINNGSEQTFQILGGSSSGGSGLTSVGISMPSAFTVSNSPLTSNGTIAISGAGLTTQYIRGNGTLGLTDTGMIPNFHLKVRSLLSGSSPIAFNQTTGVIGINNANTSGTKGAASFTGAFSDNGSGLIDLLDLVSAGSCTGCNLNIDAKGRITGYSDGAGGGINNVNIGAGFRPVNAITQEMRTYFAGFGQRLDSISNTNGLTWSADTTRGSGLPTYFYVDSMSRVIYANNGLHKDADTVKWGQPISTVGNPAALTFNTEIPLNGFNAVFTGTGGVGIGTSSVGNRKLNITATSSTQGVNVSTVDGTGVNVATSGSGYALVAQSGGTGTAVAGNSTGTAGYGVLATSSNNNAIPLKANNFNTLTNAATPVVAEFVRNVFGVPADGVGLSIMFRGQTTTTTDVETGQIRNYLSTALHGSRSSAFEFHLVNNAVSARKALLAATGQWTWDGYPSLAAQIDTTTYKPIAIDGSGNVVKMSGWPGTGGGGGGATLNNIGGGDRWVSTSSGDIKTAYGDRTIKIDSISHANALTIKADTTVLATRTDLQADTLVWYRQGVVLSPSLPADDNNLQEPSVIREDNPVILTGEDTVFKMWYTQGWTTPNICYAESVDGRNWTRYSGNPLITDYSRASILKDGSTYVLYATPHLGGSLDRYTSSDGVTFTLANAGIITPGAPGTWNSSGVFNSWVIKDGSTYRMLIDGLGPEGYFDGYFTSSDGISWTPYASNPVTYITGPYFQKVGSTFWLWGHAAPTKALTPTDGYRAHSTDMITWTYDPIPYNSTFHRMTVDEGVDSVFGQVADFNLLPVGDSVYMFYSASQNGNNASGMLQLKLAVAYRPVTSLVASRENATLFNIWETAGRNIYYDIGNVAINKRLLVGNLQDDGLGDTLQVTGNARVFGNFNTSGVINSLKIWTGAGTGVDNVVIGSVNSLVNNTTGNSNTVIGSGSAVLNTTGIQNIMIGTHALEANTSGSFNTAIGSYNMTSNVDGGFNTSIGNVSMSTNISGSNNTAIGRASLLSSTSDGSTAIGSNAGRAVTSGTNNTAIGFNSFYTDGTTASANVSGSAAIGYNAQVTQSSSGVFGGLDANGFGMRWGFGITAPSAWVHIQKGKASAGFAPLKIDSGVVLTTPEKYAIEVDGNHIYWTDRTATRFQLDQQGGGTTIYNGDGTLSANRNLSGDNKQLNLGVPGSKLSGLGLTTSGQIFFDGQMQVSSAVAADADYSITLTNTFIVLPQITANRNVSLSSPGTGAGKLLIIWNKNSSGNSWTFTNGSVVDATGAAITNLTNDTAYILMNDGTDWVKLN